ncbi:hypothetical protein HanIR_Chr07g0320781 [Helianthus annuus]|nr:hypothetical protein HanIR_Chr07g0320781 [Helianthus annuus]
MVNDASVSSFYIGFVLGSVTVMYMSAFRVSFRYSFRSVRVSVFVSVLCLHLFSVLVSVSVPIFVMLCFAFTDMTLLVLLISPLLSNFWLSRSFLYVFVLFVLQVIWDFSEKR